jgi:hypothetical protein
MASLKKLKTQIENANALGIANLTEKGVNLPETATTYEIMKGIAEVSSGGGRIYRNIVYNEDDTIDLIEKDGTTHKLECEYVDGMVSQIKLDDKKVRLEYDGQVLVKLGVTNISTTRAPTDVTVDDSGVVSFSGSVNEQGILSL